MAVDVSLIAYGGARAVNACDEVVKRQNRGVLAIFRVLVLKLLSAACATSMRLLKAGSARGD